jgi:tricorn protease
VPLTSDSPVDDLQPAFSPDGEQVAFRSEREGGGIFLMSPTGESVRRVSAFGFDPCFSPDGREIVVGTAGSQVPTDRGARSEMWAIDVASGRKRQIVRSADAIQPRVSPHGTRIAYWGLCPDSGQRDVWTVAADGSELETGGRAVTEDAPFDWSPAWAPDGRHLYFSSSRGGTMSLWRVPIDEATGRVTGALEPLTTPSLWAGHYSLASDGKRISFESLDWRSTLHRVRFDAGAGKVTGVPVPVFRSTGRPIRDHAVSPDGEWVAFNRAGVQEDIFLTRVDGTQFRRLTDDAFRDRGPAWSPDGKRLAFYSDRSGRYELWGIRPDGSGLEQLTERRADSANIPTWDPAGSRLVAAIQPRGWVLFQLAASGLAREEPGKDIDAPNRFWPMAWSPDGRRLAGLVVRPDGLASAAATYEFASSRYERVFTSEGSSWIAPTWLADSRRLLIRDRQGIHLLDPAAGVPRRILDVTGYFIGRSVGVTADDRWITYTETATDGDIWLMTLE